MNNILQSPYRLLIICLVCLSYSLPSQAAPGYTTAWEISRHTGACYSSVDAACKGLKTPYRLEKGPTYSNGSVYCCNLEGFGCSATGGLYGLIPCNTEAMCPSPYILDGSGSSCVATCNTGEQWDASSKACTSPPTESSCETQSKNPIDFIEGKKYRTEPVIQLGNQFPIRFRYHYNSHTLKEKHINSLHTIGGNRIASFIADTIPSMTESEYRATYNSVGISPSYFANASQYLGHTTRYWRHNYEDLLFHLSANGNIIYKRYDGTDITFNSQGISAAYPSMRLEPLTGNDLTQLGFTGRKLINRQTRLQRYFDDQGRLRRIDNGHGIHHDLLYAADTGNLTRINHSNGAYLTLEYTALAAESIYNLDRNATSDHLIRLTDSQGRTVDIQWNGALYGGIQRKHLITRITQPYLTGTATRSRDYEYTNIYWPAALTDIYQVSDIDTNEKRLYASFGYNNNGQALFSELAGGKERVSVAYPEPTHRIVTNALGKESTFTFSHFHGVKRLASVRGEATVNCVESNTQYDYSPSGKIKTKTVNGVITRYTYGIDAEGRETEERRDAFGTAQETQTTTVWSPTFFPLPEKIIEPGQTTQFEYNANGQLTSKTTSPTQPILN